MIIFSHNNQIISYIVFAFETDKQSMLKVKIHKVIPQELHASSIKSEPININGKKYVYSKNTEDNFTGYPIYLLLVFILPENSDYEYLKIDIRAEHIQLGKVISRKYQKFTEIKKNQTQKCYLFDFVPPVKGSYLINVDSMYRVQYFVQSSQPPPEKRDNARQTIKCEQPLQVHEKIVSVDNKGSISFPLFLQFSVESKMSNQKLLMSSKFDSQKLNVKQLHEDQQIMLGKNQNYFLMYQLEPKSVKEICSEKGMTIGTLKINYGEKGLFEKKISLKPTEKYIFFKGQVLKKHVPKKDIVEIEVKFIKIYNLNFNLGDLKLEISEKEMPGIKILKTSRDTINLDKNTEAIVKFSIICMKSGVVQLGGITLHNKQSLNVFFINNIFLFVGMEPEHKAEMILENTSEFHIEADLL